MSVLTLAAKEIRTLFSSPIAYAVIAVFIVLSGYTFTVTLFISKQATLVHIFFQAAVQLILLVPLITMRQFAEERRSGTLELLLTAPVREIDIVVAKFIACMVVLALMTGLTLIYAVVLSIFGQPDWGPIYSGYVGLVMFGAALASIGLMISALTANQSSLPWCRSDCSAPSGRSTHWPRCCRTRLRIGYSVCHCWRILHHSRLARCTCPTSGSFSPSSCSACS